MPISDFETIKTSLLEKLKALDPRLKYHNIDHTLDVIEQAERIAREEKPEADRYIYLLKLAALYHDSGFLKIYNGHEEVSCQIFLADAENFDLTIPEREFVCDLIRATQITAQPLNDFQDILRDADLDYLGRDDFQDISGHLKTELFNYEMISSEEEWNARQQEFLETHSYYTASSRKLREPVKQQHLKAISAL